MKPNDCNNIKETDKIVFQELEKANELYNKYEQINSIRSLTANLNNHIEENYNSNNWNHPLSISLTRI